MYVKKIYPDLTGKQFNNWLVLKSAKVKRGIKRVHYHSEWLCRCKCGKERFISAPSLIIGRTKSCGCLFYHNMSKTPTWYSWEGMIKRCSNKNHTFYHRYGGRGIRVCERWLNFKNFFSDMGLRPKGLTLDRVDNEGNYEPSNCRWADQKTQVNNSSSIKPIKFKGRMQSITLWAEELGMNPITLHQRLFINKWPIQRAFTERIRFRKDCHPAGYTGELKEICLKKIINI